MKDEFLSGRKPVVDALVGNKSIEKIWIDRAIKGELEIEIRKKAKEGEIPLLYVAKEKLNKLVSGANHQGLVAQVGLVEYQNIEDILPHVFEKGETPRFLILDKVEDVRNVGAIARSAVWFGFHAIIYPQKESARINAITIKTSAGALLEIPVCRVKSLVNTISFLKESGITIFGTEMQGKSIHKHNFDLPMAVVMGSEESGISKGVKKLVDDIISIPGTGNVESLNVSVAAAITMYEISKLTLS